MDTLNSADRDYDRFHFLVNAPALFNAVTTAVEVGIFRYLAGHPGSDFEQIHEHSGIPRHQLRVLLQAVCTTGLLIRQNGLYLNSPVAQELLASDADDSWSHILIGWKEVYYPAFSHLTAAMRAGTNTALDRYPGTGSTLYERLSYTPTLEAVFHRAMSAFTLRSIEALTERSEFAAVRRLLDVGGGDGTTSVKLTIHHPQLRCTVFDMPSVSKIAFGKIAGGCSDRVDLLPGDIFNDTFPPGADAVLFSHVLEIFSAEQIRDLLKKAYDSLPGNGKVFIYGYNVSDDETEGIYSARLGLYLNVLASGQGMAYPARDYEQWLAETGFHSISTAVGLPYEHGFTVGVK
jgi:ubiquinone/menaquinone biosynthesis C-methylase UbiE